MKGYGYRCETSRSYDSEVRRQTSFSFLFFLLIVLFFPFSFFLQTKETIYRSKSRNVIVIRLYGHRYQLTLLQVLISINSRLCTSRDVYACAYSIRVLIDSTFREDLYSANIYLFSNLFLIFDSNFEFVY